MSPSSCCETALSEKLLATECLEWTGGSLLEEAIYDTPRFLFSFKSFFFIVCYKLLLA